MKNKFLSICIGVGILFLTGGFFIRSINTANAAPSPERFIEEGTGKIGKYQMDVSSGTHERLIVWDTETGESTYYEYTGSMYGKAAKWIKGEAQLPMNPLGN